MLCVTSFTTPGASVYHGRPLRTMILPPVKVSIMKLNVMINGGFFRHDIEASVITDGELNSPYCVLVELL